MYSRVDKQKSLLSQGAACCLDSYSTHKVKHKIHTHLFIPGLPLFGVLELHHRANSLSDYEVTNGPQNCSGYHTKLYVQLHLYVH